MTTDYYIGLMSGTSMDAIDVVLMDFGAESPKVIDAFNYPIADLLRAELQALCQPGKNEIERLGRADTQLGIVFSEAVNELLTRTKIPATNISAIGSHGQTIRHCPDGDSEGKNSFTLQIGDANQISERTDITTVADFRRRDMAAGGQGAPLVPAFHAAMFQSSDQTRVIVNIGGISNITVLPMKTNCSITGFDTGPGNGLMDAWVHKHKQQNFDQNGQWAASGQSNETLLTQLLTCDYFDKRPPKSTGRELFNLNWLEQQLSAVNEPIAEADVQATLCEFTAATIAQAITQYGDEARDVIVCGGGVHNTFLMKRLNEHLADIDIKTTDDLGLPAEWVEAAAFAWLAKETLAHRPGNVPGVTGATHPVILGGIYLAH